ncbi:MAG: hypothetical protein O3A92_00300 [Verrucomicrobia bacterium]|nr:hypothetical protein [Verrucomicrobiota bacterium]
MTYLYAYNDEGERTLQGADLNGNGTLQTGVDRVTFSETNANTAHDSTTRAWETVSRVYGTTGGSLPTGKSQRSVDGLKSWSIPFEITARVATSTTVLKVSGVDGNWTTTSVSPTGLTSVSTHIAGLLRSSVTKGADGMEIVSSVSYPNTGVPATDAYDVHNRVIRASDLRTGDTTVAYLNSDQPSSVTKERANGNLTTAYTYDVMGRTLTTDSPNSVDDQAGVLNNIVTNTYDERGNVRTVVGDQTYQRDYTYDGLSRLVTLKTYGTSTSVTTWNYDTLRGWLDSKDYPDPANPLQAGDGPSYTYTDGGRLKTRLWARSVSTTYQYDFEGHNTGFGTDAKAGDLFAVDYSDSTPDVSYGYKRWGSVSAINDVSGTRTFAYRETIDLALDNEIMSTNGTSLAQQEVAIPRKEGHLYDSLGRRTHNLLGTTAQVDALADEINGVTTGGPLLAIDHVNAYTYDAQTGRLSSVIHGNAESTVAEAPFTSAYLANSNLLASTAGPVHGVSNSYEPERDVLKTKTNDDLQTTSATISMIEYGTVGSGNDAVNGIGQRLAATRSSSATYTAYSGSPTEAWKYNGKGEVVDADHSTNAKDRSYLFDGIGNRTSSTDNVGTTSYTPNALNQYSAVGSASPIHDLDGNLTDDGAKIYTWDAENRLIAVNERDDTDPENVVAGALIAEYRYDYMSRRIYKETTASAPQGAGAALFHYNGWNLCAEYAATAISTSDSTITALKRTYTWGQDLSGSLQGAGGVGGLLAIEEKLTTPVDHKGVYYPLYDGNGNVTELVKAGGTTGTTLVAHYEYDPFGNTTHNDDKDIRGKFFFPLIR